MEVCPFLAAYLCRRSHPNNHKHHKISMLSNFKPNKSRRRRENKQKVIFVI